MRFASIQYSKMRLQTPTGELTALSGAYGALQSRPGGPTQNFGWVGHNAFGPTDSWPVYSLILFANSLKLDQMSDFTAKMHQIRFSGPKPRWRSLQRSPDP